jgi:hypothetical protein
MTCHDLYIDVALGNGHTSDGGIHSRNVVMRSHGRITATLEAGIVIDQVRKEAHRQLDALLNDLICKQ